MIIMRQKTIRVIELKYNFLQKIRNAIILNAIKRRIFRMTRYNRANIRNISAGIAAGLLVGYLGKKMPTSKNKLKRKANRALNSMSDMLDTVNYMFK